MSISISSALSHIESKAWALVRKLADQPYGNIHDQYRDMVALGELGAQIIKLRDAQRLIETAETEIAKAKEGPNEVEALSVADALNEASARGLAPHDSIDVVAKKVAERRARKAGS